MKRGSKWGGLLLASVFVVVNHFSNAQLELPEDKVHWKLSVSQNGEDAEVICTVTCEPEWHINALELPAGTFGYASTFELIPSDDFTSVGSPIEPEPHLGHDEILDEDLAYHEGTFKFRQKIKILSNDDFKIKGSFSFQTCDAEKCLPPHTAEFTIRIKGRKIEEADANIEESFTEVNGDQAKDKDGNNFVNVNDEWHKVPKGNSVAFYKKYLTILEADK